MTAKQRFDYVMLKAHKDADGFLVDNPVVARVGLQEYTLPDGTIQREFRPRSEVFAWDSLESYRGKAITLGHVVVTTDNAKKVTVGNCSGAAWAEEAEGKVRCPIIIMDGKAIEMAESKKANEISVGYTTIDIHEPGWGSNQSGEFIFKRDMPDDYVVPSDWVEFDVLQTQIRVNHVALVKKGRAGVAKLNLDSSEDFSYDNTVNSKNEDSVMLVKLKIDSAEVEVTQDVANHINKLDELVKAANSKADGLEAERDALQIKVDGIDQVVADAVAVVKADADLLAGLIADASEIGVKCDGLDAKGIKLAYIKEVTGNDVSDKTDSYIETAFDIAKNSDMMSAQRLKIKGDAGQGESIKSDEIPDAQARFRK